MQKTFQGPNWTENADNADDAENRPTVLFSMICELIE
jgi:hypothetical protein